MTGSQAGGPEVEGGQEFPRPRLSRRHDLSPEEVADDQRTRILEAVAESVSVRGYAATSVEKIIELAGVSRGTFYQQFSSRYDCLLAAHEAAFDRFVETVSGACSEESGWEEKVVAAVNEVVGFADSRPQEMRLLTLDTVAADHGAAQRVLTGAERLVAMLRTGRRAGGPAAQLPPETERMLIGAFAGQVNCRLLNGEPLAGLEPQLIELLLVPYVGYEAAGQRAAEAAGPLAA